MKSKDYLDREALGIRVRQVWIEWAKTQPDPKPSWLLPWEEMLEADKEVDRMIGETIAGEAWDEADEEIEAVQERLEAQRQTAKTLLSLVDVWKARAESAERINLRSMALSVVGLLFGVVSIGILGWGLGRVPAATESAPAPETSAPVRVPVSASGPAPIVGSDETGYYVEGPDATVVHRSWPNAADYPEERFLLDCHAVCSLPGTMGSDSEPGQVLVADPPHLVCVCLHPDAGNAAWAIQRWVGWERVR